MKFNDLTGKKFDKILVLSFNKKVEKGKNSKYYWNCRCDCGKEFVRERSSLLNKRNKNKSCGCYSENRLRDTRTKHGMTDTRFYDIYHHMKSRVSNPKDKKYKNYGGRGIGISESWNSDFMEFKNDMYESYLEHSRLHGEKNTTIDRVNVDGDYTKENCVWKTIQEQENNKVIHTKEFEVVNAKTGEVLFTGNNRRQVANTLGISDTHIGSVLNGNRKTTYGYIFRYIEIK